MTNQIKNIIDTYGAVGDGVTDDTAAIQDAFDNEYALYIPAKKFRITSPIIQRKTMNIFGANEKSQIWGDFATAQNGVIILRFDEVIDLYDRLTNGMYSTFGILSSYPSIYVDMANQVGDADSVPDRFVNRLLVQNMKMKNTGGGHSFKIHNPNNSGFFCSTFVDNFFHGGLGLLDLGDSVNIERNTITGPGNGIDLSFQPGASHTVISRNNITSEGRAINAGAYSLNLIVEYNQIEHPSGSTDWNVVVDGVGCANPIIRGNNINGHNSTAGGNIYLGNCFRGVIDENSMGAAPVGVTIASTCTSVHIGQRNLNYAATPYNDASASTVYEFEGGVEGPGEDPGGPPVEGDVAGKVNITKTAALIDANKTIFTYEDVAIGTATADRQVVVAVWHYDETAYTPIVTVGGTAATLVTSGLDGTYPQVGVRLFKIAVATGTQADIVVTFGGEVLSSGIAVYRVVNAKTTAHDTASDNSISSGVVSATIDVPADGGVIACCQAQTTPGTYATAWTGVDEDADFNVNHGGGSRGFSSGHKLYATAQTGLTLSATISAGAFGSLAAASFEPL